LATENSKMYTLNHLPNNYALHASTQHALKMKLCMESLLSVPRSVVIDGLISYGGSTGSGLELPAKSFSEFFERNHLFTKVPVDAYCTLEKIQPDTYRDKLIKLCNPKKTIKDCYSHSFAMTEVNQLLNHQPQYYFHNAISLIGHKNDMKFLNVSDSCACAAHPEKEKAIYNSLMEFIERQALLGSWLTKRHRYRINPELLKVVTPYTDLVDRLLDNGELYIYENGLNLPAYTIIMFYFSHSSKDLVQYSIGSSSGLTLGEALHTSLVELYQCYAFLYNTESSAGLEDKAGSGYHLKFQKCNHQKTKEKIPFINENEPFSVSTEKDLYAKHAYTFEEVLSALAATSQDIYYYHCYEPALKLHFTKVMSPDYFAHMSLPALNLDNAYAKKCGISRENAYFEPIPFP